ncbi:MAG TPA: DUF370 domain-containing protein [Clostridiales bacterium]|nr:DUF370 domain-containing protein [Clostridiales bacterium]
MFLHLGGDTVVFMRDIIAIFDYNTAISSDDTKEFLSIAKEEGFVRVISEDTPKSFILTEIDKKSVVYLSPISSTTLKKRSNFVSTL